MLRKLINCVQQKRHRFVVNLTGGIDGLSKRALLYYKTEPFYDRKALRHYAHTNLWEVLEIVRLLNHYGFVVDVVDRSVDDFVPEDIYDLMIGLGAGNSGKHFYKYGSALSKAVKILYAAGPEPDLSNELVLERYHEFRERTGIDAPAMRTITEVDFQKFMSVTDCIFCIGEPGLFSYESYRRHGKPIHSVMPSSSPQIRFSPDWLSKRHLGGFLCFAGHGFICKGVDLMVEAFAKMPELKLYIGGPDSEPAFFRAYGDLIKNSGNIFYKGFVQVGSDAFHRLCSTCAWVILNSASEGCATSVTTCLRAGLAPVVNWETSVDVGDFGFLMEDKANRIEDIIRTCRRVSNLDSDEYRSRVYKALASSLKYTQSSFTESFSRALLAVIK